MTDLDEMMLVSRVRTALASGEGRKAVRAARIHDAELATLWGVTQKSVSGWFTGHVIPNREHSLAIAELFDRLGVDA
jgi:hypothetical protein